MALLSVGKLLDIFRYILIYVLLLDFQPYSIKTDSSLETEVFSTSNIHTQKPSSPYVRHRLGGWLPHDAKHFQKWLHHRVEHVRQNPKRPEELHPSIQAFLKLIESNQQVYMLFHMMFEQVPPYPPYIDDPIGTRQIRDWRELLQVFDYQLTEGPLWLYTTAGQQVLVGFPFNAILDWPMGTPAGVFAFLREDVNQCFRDMLNEYGDYLRSSQSVSVLNTGAEGWFSPDALLNLSKVVTIASGHIVTFPEAYKCNPKLPAYGFSSWDDFFIRTFNPGIRPIAYPDQTNIINNACESTPYALSRNVQLRDKFWIKGQLYSLLDMLVNKTDAERFVGGTCYQAFLSALSYHRWHAPVSGIVVKIDQVPGSYYAANYWEGFAYSFPTTPGGPTPPLNPDPSAPNNSQGYLCHVATRALIYILADNPRIGLMCVVEVGMAEVSSCEVTVQEGQYVYKGDEIGMFHFGGSTHCLLFQPGVNLRFTKEPPYTDDEVNLPVCGWLATLV